MSEQQLSRAANVDGGWPYYEGNASRLEPTAWALLALPASERERSNAITFVAASQGDDGLFVDASAPYANFTAHALALLACLDRPGAAMPIVGRAAGALVREKGIRIPLEHQYCQNNKLQGWGWCPGTFSWLEPTAWAMLALKKAAAAGAIDSGLRTTADARLAEADRLLLDRACARGGWNYGNSNMYGRELHAHVPTTAVALLAMQDRRDEPAVRRGLEFLWTNRLTEPTGMALALASMCLRVFGRPTEDIEPKLIATLPTTARRRHVHVLAMSIYALNSNDPLDALRL